MRSAWVKRGSCWALFGAVLGSSGCGTKPALAPQAPLLRDPDRRPFEAQLEPYYSPSAWDHLDNSFFRPASRFFAVRPGGEAVNANQLDEVPDSSWFENRVHRLDTLAVAQGPCSEPAPDARTPWRVVSGKPDGVNPGFVIQDARGQRYVIKLDDDFQGPRASTADVVASRIYFAAGFDVPCNQIVYFERSSLVLRAGAEVARDDGRQETMTWRHLERALSKAPRRADGRIRAVASRYLAGRPLGPWRYEGIREGDRNDVVPHEDRRELRASRLLAAWTGHWDARAQNTLAMWIETAPGRGFVRHHLLDFGECFGAFSGATPVLIRRRGEVYFYDPWQVLADFSTLGAVERSWDRGRLGPSGAVFGYYDVDGFEPEAWTTSFPNAAFGRMTEHDAAWMARIVARIEPYDVQAMVGAAALSDELEAELVRVLLGRRRKLLARYLQRLSPLASPTFAVEDGRSWLCADDLGVQAAVASRRSYSARVFSGYEGGAVSDVPVRHRGFGRVCVPLANAPYWVVELSTQALGTAPYPARFHVHRDERNQPSLVKVERLDTPDD